MKTDKTFVAIKEDKDTGKSVSMKSMIYRLALTANKINLAIANSCDVIMNNNSINIVNQLIGSSISSFSAVKCFNIYSYLEFSTFFNKCIQLTAINKDNKIFEIDFLAILEFENDLKIGFCTIGDHKKVIEINLCDSNTDVLNKYFQDCDVIFCACRLSSTITKTKLTNICNDTANSIAHHNMI